MRQAVCLLLSSLGAVATACTADDTASSVFANRKLFIGYHELWSETAVTNGEDALLAHLPGYVNVVSLAFMPPDTGYVPGSVDLAGSGIVTKLQGPVLRDAIASLHERQPTSRVLISVGGWNDHNWASFNSAAVAAFVDDFGLDGVDLDFEPRQPDCRNVDGIVQCASDADFVNAVLAMRAAMPRPKILAAEGFAVGAYGESEWIDDGQIEGEPKTSAWAGSALAILRNPRTAEALDVVNIMSYNAGNRYRPEQALRAYRHYYRGRLTMGISVPPDDAHGHSATIEEVDELADTVNAEGVSGMMLWSLQKAGPRQAFASKICTRLGLADCDAEL